MRALDLWWVVWVVGVDDKGENEGATLVHALIGGNRQVEVEEISGIWEMCFHGRR